ncbi:acetolactate decarboxylase [Rathayibacter sp. AY1H3]|uniref:acetolactate decarboxylase n=1 Tax=Rathayibacter sp. AY1H3 TaxID=2080567 RepID=UPI002158487E|nr:acetolactate decarboxylase [Rathayibacter sp. AY1H3]
MLRRRSRRSAPSAAGDDRDEKGQEQGGRDGPGEVLVHGPQASTDHRPCAATAPDHAARRTGRGALARARPGRLRRRPPARAAETPALRRPIAQAEPYRRLADAMRDQHEVRLTGVEGTLLGFVGPQPFQGISVAGLHTHVVDTTGGIGGHVLAASGVAGLLEIEQYGGITLLLLESDDHPRADLDAVADAGIRAVETDHPP